MSERATAADPIAAAFEGHGKQAALMPYIMGGYPDLATSRDIGFAAADAGADVLELGVPFSDPLADGPVIHAAATDALAAGATLAGVLEVCEQVAERVPVVLMVYANVVLAGGGAPLFARHAAEAGAAGLIVPDLPHGESGGVLEACDDAGIALVPLVAPNTTPDQLDAIGRDARGFVYTVSLTGTTGERSELPAELSETVARVRESSAVPVAVGFGISTAEQAARVGRLADGVIVGSRVVRAAGEGGADGVREVVEDLAAGLALR